MSSLRLDKLFTFSNGEPSIIGGGLNVETLFTKRQKKFSSDSLLEYDKKQKIKLDKIHERYYELCCDKINEANSSGIKDLIFRIDEHMIQCLLYNSRRCLEFIEERLNNEKILTFIKSSTEIFITWKNLSDRKNKQDSDSSNDTD